MRDITDKEDTMFLYNSKLKKYSQELRKNMTPEERHLWYDFLKKLPLTVKRQFRIGDYIVDFYIPEKRIIIEIDGRQHLMEENKNADEARDQKLKNRGLTVIRISNKTINNDFNKVVDWLMKALEIDYSELR